MTDLSKGIIEINGVHIDKNTTPEDFQAKLTETLCYAHKFKDGTYMFQIKNVVIENREFLATFRFEYNSNNQLRLEKIHLLSVEYKEKSAKELLKEDKIWLESILGSPDININREADYELDNVYIQPIFLPYYLTQCHHTYFQDALS